MEKNNPPKAIWINLLFCTRVVLNDTRQAIAGKNILFKQFFVNKNFCNNCHKGSYDK